MRGPALPKDHKSISVPSLRCNVQQMVVMLLSVPSWLADVDNQRYCRKKNILALPCLSSGFAHSPVFLISFLRYAGGRYWFVQLPVSSPAI